MNHFITKTALLTATLMIAALPVLADEGSVMGPGYQSGKDERLLAAAGTCDRVGTFDGMIEKIQNEISKGNVVYTNDELRILHERLDNLIEQNLKAHDTGSG